MVYNNSLEDRNLITSLYKDVTGIYLWHNLVNGKQYIGSGYKLSVRLAQYYYPSKLLSCRYITQSILKYGHDNFSVIIFQHLPLTVQYSPPTLTPPFPPT